MSARDEVLARVRAALGAPPSGELDPAVAAAGESDDPTDTTGTVPRDYRVTGDLAPGSAAVIDLLEDRLVDYKAVVVRAATEHEAAEAVARALPAEGVVVVPDGLPDAWLAALPETLAVRRDSRTEPLGAAELDATVGVVTAARVAIAQTGTIVLDGEPDQGRRAVSLVPDLHVCVVRTSQVVELVPEAVRMLGAHPTRPQTWISGPSATSDIELSRVEGVHGPRTLHVVLLGR